MIQLIVNRDLSRKEFKWLKKDIKNGGKLNLRQDIPIEELPSLLADIKDDESGISYRIFMTEQIGDNHHLYARSDDIIIKISPFEGKVLFEYITEQDIEPSF